MPCCAFCSKTSVPKLRLGAPVFEAPASGPAFLKRFGNILIGLTLLLLFSCESYEHAFKTDTKRGASDEVVIGVVGTVTASVKGQEFRIPNQFFEGVNMAVDEANEAGGIIGKKVRTIQFDDGRSIEKGRLVARKLAKNSDVVAVVGHRYSGVAVPASITYQENGILFISHGATSPSFTEYGGNLTFRNIPSDAETGRIMAELACKRGFKKIFVFYQRDTVGKQLAENFNEYAVEMGIEIVATRSYFHWVEDFRIVLSEITKSHEFDAVLLAGLIPLAADFVKQARDMGVKVPIIGSYMLDAPDLFSIAGRNAEGVIVPTTFNPNLLTKNTRDFVRNFKKKYGVTPDAMAAQGYDAVQLLFHAIRKSGSTTPIVLASTLRILQEWEGVTGSYSFKMNGDIVGKSIYFKEVRKGRFEFLEHELGQEVINPYYSAVDTTIRLPLDGSVSTIDPTYTSDVISIEVTEQLFLGLTDFDPETYEPVGELATEWEVGDDGKTYVFHMRKDARWTDGSPVTAHDIVWAVRRNVNPKTNCPYAGMLYVLKNGKAIHQSKISETDEIGVEALDDYTVKFTLEHAAAYFPSIAGIWVYRPLPGKIIEKFGEKWTGAENIVTNGSYRLALWKKGIVMALRKNPNYYDAAKVSIPEVRYYVIPDNSLGLMMYENNDLDIMGSSYLRLPLMGLRNIVRDPVLGREYSMEPQFCNYAYGFNTLRPPVDNVLVRKAIIAAVDREFIIELITQGGEEPARTFTRPPVFGSVPSSENIGIQFNPVQAQKWLAEAGYPEGKGFPKITLLFNSSETHLKIARAMKASLKHYLDIDIDIRSTHWDEFMNTIGDKDRRPHLFRFGWCGDYPDANNWLKELFHPADSDNYIGWDNKEFAEFVDNALRVTDQAQRKEFYFKAERLLCEEEAAVVPIFFETAHCLVKPRVKGWYHMALGGQHIRDWYFSE